MGEEEYILGNVHKGQLDWWEKNATPLLKRRIKEFLIQRQGAHFASFEEFRREVLLPIITEMFKGVSSLDEVKSIFQKVEKNIIILKSLVPMNTWWWNHHSLRPQKDTLERRKRARK